MCDLKKKHYFCKSTEKKNNIICQPEHRAMTKRKLRLKHTVERQVKKQCNSLLKLIFYLLLTQSLVNDKCNEVITADNINELILHSFTEHKSQTVTYRLIWIQFWC